MTHRLHTIDVNPLLDDDGNHAEPKAIVVLFGWLGCRPKHLGKYAELYRERHQCSTIHTTAPVVPVMLYHLQSEQLQTVALEAADEALKLLKVAKEDTPLIIHAFSGSGCVVLEQLENLMMAPENQTKKNWVLLRNALARGGQVFDSAPAYLSTRSGLMAIRLAVPNSILARFVVQCLFLLYVLLQWAVDLEGAKEHQQHFMDSALAPRQAYIYSTCDSATDPAKLQELISHREMLNDTTILYKELDDSPHCGHLVYHPGEYKALLTEFFESIAEQEKQEELLEEDPDMTEYQMEMD